jgi:uncharacterized membrane protein YdcZ (DUF606 family)
LDLLAALQIIVANLFVTQASAPFETNLRLTLPLFQLFVGFLGSIPVTATTLLFCSADFLPMDVTQY